MGGWAWMILKKRASGLLMACMRCWRGRRLRSGYLVALFGNGGCHGLAAGAGFDFHSVGGAVDLDLRLGIDALDGMVTARSQWPQVIP
jgi:hypothetical protein